MRDLQTKSMPLDSVHHGGITELDTHSLFGTMEVKATHDWFKSRNQRTMIIERSAYAGLGKFGSRWLGDNWSQERYMGFSITGVMAHNIMGIPLVGSDICGFIGNTNSELCARWHVVGSFYPFSRNHNNWEQIPQEPYHFTERYEGSVQYLDIMRMAIYNKYNMIRYYYTELMKLSRLGGTFFKPLFFEFDSDPNTLENQELNIMLGSALKLSVLSNTLDQNTTDFYFPAGTWCEMKKPYACVTYMEGQKVNLPTKVYDFHLHLREGYMVPYQDAQSLGVMNSVELQDHPVDFHVNALCEQTYCHASGTYLNDDGVTLDGPTENLWTFKLTADQVLDTVVIKINNVGAKPGKVNGNDKLGSIYIMNAEAIKLTTDYTVTAKTDDSSKDFTPIGTASYDAATKRLIFTKAKDTEVSLLEY